MNYTKIELSYIIPIYISNPQSTMLSSLIQHYENYSEEILQKIQFIFVNDCSPLPVEVPKDCKLNYILAQITDDIQWNQGGARNLGVHLSKSSKLILTDLDHIFPESLLIDLLKASEPKKLYMFRREIDGIKTHSHANTFFCSKSLFFKTLGVDEEFCGHYGYEDVYFMQMQKALGTKIRKFSKKRIIVKEHKNTNNELHHLKRDLTVNEALLSQKLKTIENGKPFSGHSRLFLNFKWNVVEEKFIY